VPGNTGPLSTDRRKGKFKSFDFDDFNFCLSKSAKSLKSWFLLYVANLYFEIYIF
jgi:hypothetical protein